MEVTKSGKRTPFVDVNVTNIALKATVAAVAAKRIRQQCAVSIDTRVTETVVSQLTVEATEAVKTAARVAQHVILTRTVVDTWAGEAFVNIHVTVGSSVASAGTVTDVSVNVINTDTAVDTRV